MRNLFWLDNECCKDYGIVLQNSVEFDSPQPKLSTITIPGHNGDLHIFEGAYTNVAGRANCYILNRSVSQLLPKVSQWLILKNGYRKFETTDEPDHYRLARVVNGPEAAIRMRLLAPFTIEFDCKPQKFLKTGENPITITSKTELYNFDFPSSPLIKIYGNSAGNVYIGDYTVQVKTIDEYVTLDCDTQNAYKGTLNKNNTINITEFPQLIPGENSISWNGGINRIEITPRWWTL